MSKRTVRDKIISEDIMSLTDVKPGEHVKLILVEGGKNLRDKLTSLGIMPGVEVSVIKNTYHGPVLIEVLGSKIALGRGMAHKIKVQ